MFVLKMIENYWRKSDQPCIFNKNLVSKNCENAEYCKILKFNMILNKLSRTVEVDIN